MSLFGDSTKDKTAIICDVGSSSVGVAYVRFPKEKRPIVLYAKRERIQFDNLSSDRIMELIVKSLHTLLKETDGVIHNYVHYSKKGEKPEDVYCVISSPWHVGRTRVLEYKREAPFVVTRDWLQKIISSEERIFKDAFTRVALTENRQDVRLIENRLIQSKLNGYITHAPFDKECNHVEFSLYLSMIAKSFEERLGQSIKNIFPGKRVHFASFSLIYYLVVRDMFPRESDFLLINIGGEISDVSVIKKGIVLETVSLPIGKNFIIRKVGEAMNIKPQLASSLINLYASGNAEASLSKRIEEILKGTREKWLHYFEDALLAFSEEIFLPKKIFLTVNNDFGSFFLKSLGKDEYAKYTITNEPFDISLLSADKIASFCDFGNNVTRDSFLGIQSIYFHHFEISNTNA